MKHCLIISILNASCYSSAALGMTALVDAMRLPQTLYIVSQRLKGGEDYNSNVDSAMTSAEKKPRKKGYNWIQG